MMCHISKGDTPLEVYWEFNGRPLSQELGMSSKVGDRSSVLMLPSVTGAHSGNYTCIAKNRAGEASYTTILKIIVPPHIMPFEIEESIYYGESVQMNCHARKGDLPMSITWTFEGKDLSKHVDIKTMKMAEQTSFLTIASVTGAHSGNYTCIARNKAGEDRYSTYLHVKVVPHIKPFELDEAVFAGESVHLDCHVSKGDTPLNITWAFQGQPVNRRMGLKTTTLSERVSVLDIPNALGANSGNYTCIATNRAGTATHTAVLNVIGTNSYK
ncbi:immunoglobulin i-set domain-containing protein [Phthorimaea operculella]|nr:immunoglobulin i-set domain-containing protein [Phthorimaea operculella]